VAWTRVAKATFETSDVPRVAFATRTTAARGSVQVVVSGVSGSLEGVRRTWRVAKATFATFNVAKVAFAT